MSRRSRSKPLPKPPAQEFPDDEEIGDDEADDLDEEQEITRCVCGNDELQQLGINNQLQQLLLSEYEISIDQGLFIQCDKCSVWQHGYCVGLFINDDVPDKYWCEQCRPENHIEIVDEDRTLYKSVNEKRKILMAWNLEKKPRSGKRGAAVTSDGRKDRRSNDSYDEQLEKALRESARESGVPLGDIESRSGRKKRIKADDEESSSSISKATSPSKRRRAGVDSDVEKRSIPESEVKIKIQKATSSPEAEPKNDHDKDDGADAEAEDEEDDEDDEDDVDGESVEIDAEKDSKPSTASTHSKSIGSAPTSASSANSTTTSPATKKKPGRSKKSNININMNNNNKSSAPAPTKEELTNQASKPRFVNSKSSIYELRKRTGAILEWLGRSQLELEEEKASKFQLFLYHEGGNKEQTDITNSYDHNLKLMERLTEKILDWEQKYGRYAP